MFRAALVLHLVLAVSAVGSSVHVALFSLRTPGAPRTRRLALLALLTSLAAFIVGALVYPSYKVEIRAAYLEAAQPAATRAFDLKEQLVALALPLQLGLFWLLRTRAARPALVRGLAGAAAALLVVAGLLSAWVVTTHAWR